MSEFEKYTDAVRRTANPSIKHSGPLGLCGESGEVADLLKKHLYHGHELDLEKLESELGDVLWYLAAIADQYGTSLDVIARKNIAKLESRYPEGWDKERSKSRDGKAEAASMRENPTWSDE